MLGKAKSLSTGGGPRATAPTDRRIGQQVNWHGWSSGNRRIRIYPLLHYLPRWRAPAIVCPECNCFGTFAKNEDIALRDFRACQTGERMLNKASGNTSPAMGSSDLQMMEVPSSAIVA